MRSQSSRKVENNTEMDERKQDVRLEGEAGDHTFSRGVSHTLQEVFLNRKLGNEVDNVSTLGPYQIAGGFGHAGLIAVLLYWSPEP